MALWRFKYGTHPAHLELRDQKLIMSMESLLLDIEDVIVVYEQQIEASATRTRQMIERYGPIDALSRLVVNAELQSGFRVLRDRNRLDMTFESLVVRHAKLFHDDVVRAANWRLENPHSLG